MKTILFSFATTDTAGPSAEVSVPTRKSTLSFRMSSRATRTASLASALESRTMQLELAPAEHAALGVDLVHVHLGALGGGLAEQRGRARERHGHADLDRLLRFGGQRQREQPGEQQA